MQDAGNQDAARFLAIKHHMPPLLYAPQSKTNVIAGPAERGIISNQLAALLKLTKGTICSRSFAPSAQGIMSDVIQVGLSPMRKAESCHGLTRWPRKIEFLPQTRAKTLPSAMPLLSPSSIAARNAASFASYCCSSRSISVAPREPLHWRSRSVRSPLLPARSGPVRRSNSHYEWALTLLFRDRKFNTYDTIVSKVCQLKLHPSPALLSSVGLDKCFRNP